MRRSPFTYLYGCLVVSLLAGCVSPLQRGPLQTDGREYPNVRTSAASVAKPQDETAQHQKPIVRSQNASVRFGGVAQAGYNAPPQPMPVSGQSYASPIPTTVNNGYATQTQFTNPAGAAKGNEAWSLPPQATPQQIRQQLTARSAPKYQPPQTTPQQPGTYQVAQALPPAGYPGAPQYPGTPPSHTIPRTPSQLYPNTQQQPAQQGLWSQQPAAQPLAGQRYGGTTAQQPNGSPDSAIIKPPGSPNAPSGIAGQLTPSAGARSPSGAPSATLSPSVPQGLVPQGLGPQGNFGGGLSQTVPAQPGNVVAPPIGGWPQAFGQPQPPGPPGGMVTPSQQFADVIVNVQETQTGKFMIGAAVNSDAGLTGQIVIDEQNFDWRAWPRSVEDFLSGRAFRGGGQRLRIEALPGDRVQRYMVQFSEPYLAGTRITFNLSGYFFDRRYFDWDENRLGIRTGLGYRISPDLSIAGGIRAERVRLTEPRVPAGTVPELDEALGQTELYSGNISLTHDTRDISFAPTQGHYFRFTYDQVFGSFDYGRGEIDWRRYFLVTERPDGSGRHVLGFSNRFALSGSETPIYENYFAGGHATLRGFEFRGASPEVATVTVGGRMMFLGSVEYLFPITADDMLKGVVFCDYGTVEEDTDVDWNDFRVALGAGLRVSIAAMGPAPIALDFAVPVSKADTDDTQSFSFFVGVSR